MKLLDKLKNLKLRRWGDSEYTNAKNNEGEGERDDTVEIGQLFPDRVPVGFLTGNEYNWDYDKFDDGTIPPYPLEKFTLALFNEDFKNCWFIYDDSSFSGCFMTCYYNGELLFSSSPSAAVQQYTANDGKIYYYKDLGS